MWQVRHIGIGSLGFVCGLLAVDLAAQTVRSPASQFPSVSSESNGSSGTPAFRFVSQPTVGWYLLSGPAIGVTAIVAPSADATYDLGITATNRWRNAYLSGTETVDTVRLGDGSSSTPSLTFSNQVTTGFYRFASAVIGVVGGLKFGTDATYDLGAVSANRPNNGYFAGLVAGATHQVGAGTASTSNVQLSNTTGRLNVKFGDASDQAPVYAQAFQMAPGATSQPTCDSTQRGKFWYTPNGSGVFDTLQFCAKDDTDTYHWFTVFFF